MSARKGHSEATIVEVLREDHEHVRDLLDKLEGTSERAVKSRQSELKALHKEVLGHMIAEEQVFYPWVQEHEKDKAFEAAEEHEAARMLLERVEKTEASDEHWKARVKVLSEVIHHHLSEEEDEIFEMAEEEMEEEQSRQMAVQFREVKEGFKT